MLAKHGNYDISIAGAVAEAYAEETLGMVKAEAGLKGIDGWINGRSVQVKGKAPRIDRHLSQLYVSIGKASDGLAQHLFVLLIRPDMSFQPFGPVRIDRLPGRPHSHGHTRYYLHDIEKVAGS